ncbi:hypothetical protein HNQ77_000933 [Silvibacterium bohemicum]|uniref:DUF2059 domain-containing protein n=1 Tax=Silvibacterium bohemicum TaxID=1577686 RepID=A0A841JTB9_9BACT|nr:DUF2059 domain-containing protein [Silvibacterium bohemicum]MBB6142989.1 hypothetical protein [Silvibacterium bohemicum]
MRLNSFSIATMLVCSSLSLNAQDTRPVSAATAPLQTESRPSAISPEKSAKIDEMLTVTGTKSELSEVLSQGKTALKMFASRKVVVPGESLEKNKGISPEEKKLSEDYRAEINKIADTEFGIENLEAAMVRYCADNFSDENIDGIIAFYKSPAGKAMLEKGPALNHVAYDFMEKLKTRLGSETDQITTAYIEKRNVIHPPLIAEPAVTPKTAKPDTRTSTNREPETGADGDGPE